ATKCAVSPLPTASCAAPLASPVYSSRSANPPALHSFPTRRSSDLLDVAGCGVCGTDLHAISGGNPLVRFPAIAGHELGGVVVGEIGKHTSELQSREKLVCRLLLEKKKKPRLRSYLSLHFFSLSRRH